MRKNSKSGRSGPPAGTNRTRNSARFRTRRIGFEGLEQRRLLSTIGLSAISAVNLPAGASIMVPLNGNDPNRTINFGATASDPTKVTPSVMPQTNKSVSFSINGQGIVGTMTFQLFDNLTPGIAGQIEALANSTNHVYTGDYIYRSSAGFVVQGGNILPTITNGQVTGQSQVNTVPSSIPSAVNDEFNPDLTYTSAGSLGFAIPSPNEGSSEFFIGEGTTEAQQALNYSYSLFGFQTVNQAITVNGQATTVLQALEADSTSADTVSGNSGDLLNPIKIVSATVFTDTQNGVLLLRAPSTDTVGSSFTVTVTAWDGTNTPATQTFTVNVVAPTSGTITNPWASQTPSAPISIQFQPQSGQTATTFTSANNSSTSQELHFLVSGVTVNANDEVTLYADGVAIGSAPATAAQLPIATNGALKLPDGTYTFTATETAENASATWTDSQNNSRTDSANVDSYSSPGVQVQVSTSLAVTSTPAAAAAVGQPYSYTLQTNAPSGDAVTVQYTTAPYTKPADMQFNTSTNTFTWTPGSADLHTSPEFYVQATDSLGHTATVGPVYIAVAAGPVPVSVPVNVSLGGNVTVSFSGSQVEVYDNVGKAILSQAAFKSTDTLTIELPAGQANSVAVDLPNSAGAPLPQDISVQGATGSTNNQVAVVGTGGANTYTLAGGTVTANGLTTTMTTVQKLTLQGGGGNDYYTLNSAAMPVAIVDSGGYNTLDFSHDTAGVAVNLGLDKGQAQSIAPWNTTLSLTGVIDKLIGSAYNDDLTGGQAATTEILAGGGNDTITGGGGDNILVGGGGNDTITGGQEKNLIIGGAGNCSLYAEGSENIIFAGTTNVDTNDQALLNLLEQGSRATYGYSVRRLLASAARNRPSLSTPVLFQDTGAHDTIFGSGINNWFVLGQYGTLEK
jgi:cyclophilin family peptidyl-prolyl cis-trans isomerase